MRLAYYLEDNDLQREVMLEILHDIFHDAVSFVPFSCLDDLKQACIQQFPCFVVSDLDVADAKPAQTIEFLKTLIRRDIPVVVASGQVDDFAWEGELAEAMLFPKGSGFKLLKQIASQVLSKIAAKEVRLTSETK
jgi:CheY-like chemotaxis protein